MHTLVDIQIMRYNNKFVPKWIAMLLSVLSLEQKVYLEDTNLSHYLVTIV